MVKRNFVYVVEGKGSKETAKIYQIKNNKPTKVGSVSWDRRSYKGDDSSVYTRLHQLKLVSTKEYKANSGYWDRRNSTAVITRLGY